MDGPNRMFASALATLNFSNKGLAARVRDLAARDGNQLSTDHIAIGRYLKGMQPKRQTAHYIATAMSERAGRSLSLADLGFTADEGAEREPVVGAAVEYPEAIQVATTNLGDLTRADVAPGSIAPLGRWDSAAAPGVITGYLFGGSTLDTASPAAEAQQLDALTIRTTTTHLMDLDFQLGGGHTRELLLFFFRNQVMPILRSAAATGPAGRDLFSATAELAQLLGWSAYDSGRHGAAQRYFVYALRLAKEAQDPLMGARLLSNLSHQANYIGRFEQAVQLARAGQSIPGHKRSGAVASLLFAMEARALASLGDGPGSAAAITRAEQAFHTRDPDNDPAWISYFDETELAGEAAHCFRDLRRPNETGEFATLAIKPDVTPPRTRAFITLVSAVGALHAGHLDESVEIARGALTTAGPLRSSRYQRYVHDFIAIVSRLHPRDPRITNFLSFSRDALTTG
ncbi:hypothetical protein [Pseudonocardia pini]|uniref:hypothetical protein n=1 Tax=Pseudonocardia pini TaxID=2758030 RepID=UPI0015F015CF|nr:hypothetical protein [Pseudonocardia pini]